MILSLVLALALLGDLRVNMAGRNDADALALGALVGVMRTDEAWDFPDSRTFLDGDNAYEVNGVRVNIDGVPCKIWMLWQGSIRFRVPSALPVGRPRPSGHTLAITYNGQTWSRGVLVYPRSPQFLYWYGDPAYGPAGWYQYQPGQISQLSIEHPVLVSRNGTILRLDVVGFGANGEIVPLRLGDIAIPAFIEDSVFMGLQYLYVILPPDFPSGTHQLSVPCRGNACPVFGFPVIRTERYTPPDQ